MMSCLIDRVGANLGRVGLALVTALLLGTLLFGMAQAQTDDGDSGPSEPVPTPDVALQLRLPAPPAPSSINGSANGGYAISASWSSVPDVSHYEFGIWIGDPGGWQDRNVGGSTSASQSGLAPNTPYDIRARACGGSAYSGCSLWRWGNVKTDKVKPTTPDNFSATAEDEDSIRLSWTDLGLPDEVLYNVDIERSSWEGIVNAFSGTDVRVHYLPSNTLYRFRLNACGVSGAYLGCSGYAYASARTDPAPTPQPTPQPAPAPSSVTSATINKTGINVSWQWDQHSSHIVASKLERSDDGGVTWPQTGDTGYDDHVISDISGLEQTVDDLTCDETYHFRVSGKGDGLPFLTSYGATTETSWLLDCEPPPPESLSVSLTGSTYSIVWDAVAGANEYELQYRDNPGASWTALPTVSTTSTALTLQADPACGIPYEFQVRSYGDGTTFDADWGAFSTPVSVSKEGCPVFSGLPYVFSVHEEESVGYAIGSVSATVPDTAITISYAFTAGNEDGKFALDNSSGAITLAGALDHASVSRYTLTAEANDGADGRATAEVTISVTPADCSNDIVVPNAVDNPGLVKDCETLRKAKLTLIGTGTLNWSTRFLLSSWDGVSASGRTPHRVWIIQLLFDDLSGSIPAEIGDLDALVQLYLSFNSLTGSIPKELGNLTNLTTLSLIDNQLTGSIPAELTALNLTTLELSGNSFTGCIPLALQNVPRNDLGDLGLAYCAYPPAPQGLTTLLTESSFVVSWDVLAGASKYEVQYRVAGSGSSWTILPETMSTTVTITPSGSAVCDSSYEFQVRAYGDGTGYEAGWGPAIETTDACNQPPVIAEQSFSVSEDATIGDDVGNRHSL